MHPNYAVPCPLPNITLSSTSQWSPAAAWPSSSSQATSSWQRWFPRFSRWASAGRSLQSAALLWWTQPSIFFLGLVINKVIIWEVLENNHHYHFRPKVPPPSLLKQHRYRHHHYDRRQGVQNQSQKIVLWWYVGFKSGDSMELAWWCGDDLVMVMTRWWWCGDVLWALLEPQLSRKLGLYTAINLASPQTAPASLTWTSSPSPSPSLPSSSPKSSSSFSSNSSS